MPKESISPFSYLLFFPLPEDIPADFRRGDVGFFSNKDDDSIRIPIFVDDRVVRAFSQLHSVCIVDEETPDLMGICLTNGTYYDIQRYSFLKSMLWHELGHFHSRKWFDDDIPNRSVYTAKDIIDPREEIADLFSLYYTSNAECDSTFRYLLSERRKRVESSENKKMAIQELENRLQYLKQYRKSKQLKKKIEELNHLYSSTVA